MSVPDLGPALHARLGPKGSEELVIVLDDVKTDMLRAAQEQFDARMDARFSQLRGELRSEFHSELATFDANLRVAMSDGFSKLRSEVSDMRVDILRWSFLFWVGQVVALGSLMAVLIRSLAR